MVSFRVVFKPSLEKDLRSLPTRVVPRIWKAIEALAVNPFPRGIIKLSGAEQLHRLRVGDYRIVYGVDKNARTVTVHYVRHRREAYR